MGLHDLLHHFRLAEFDAWNAAALIHVEASRLAGTSIPYILTARSILGQTGRIVMGIVVIAGACAAVNLLFQAVARMMAVRSQL